MYLVVSLLRYYTAVLSAYHYNKTKDLSLDQDVHVFAKEVLIEQFYPRTHSRTRIEY